MRRIVVTGLALAACLASAGGASSEDSRVARGRDVFAANCASCHGPQGEGVPAPRRGSGGIIGLGPPLRGVGARAADFYLRTGYMPLRNPYDQPHRQRPLLPDRDIDAVVAYVASLGGPGVPKPHPERGSLSEGLQLFTEHCAGCHQVVGAGGYVTGSVAPPLDRATAVQIAEAVRVGPYVMPRFGQRQISDRQLDSIIRYVEYARDPKDSGGWAIGHLGPVPEGMVAWLIAGSALVLVAVVIGKRLKEEHE
jgi:ubiquinol-cytochrome c reductase cytochrome c subunit